LGQQRVKDSTGLFVCLFQQQEKYEEKIKVLEETLEITLNQLLSSNAELQVRYLQSM
jgi:hypothetical protein